MLPVDAGLSAVAGGKAGASEAGVRQRLLVVVSGPDGHRHGVGVPGDGLVGLAGGKERLAEAVECLGLARVMVGALRASRLNRSNLIPKLSY
jgi:hypothetical protein